MAILKTSWYPDVIQGLVDSALGYLLQSGVKQNDVEVLSIPGSYEIPLALELLYSGQRVPDLTVVLGCVVRGETPHFEFVCETVTSGVSELSVKHKIPTGFGVLTVNTVDQAKERTTKGAEAAQAALAMYNLKMDLKG